MSPFRLCLTVLILAAAHPSPTFSKPEPVPRITRSPRPGTWYAEQAKEWESALDRRPEDPVAWSNYYWATRYTRFGEEHDDRLARVADILDRMGQAVPESYEYLTLRGQDMLHQDGQIAQAAIEMLERAVALDPDRAEAYEGLLTAYEATGQVPQAKAAALGWYRSREMPEGLLEYAYNMLASADSAGVILTNGDNDTYPLWILQKAKSIRTDIAVINLYLARTYQGYAKRVLSGHKIFPWSIPGPSSEFGASLCDTLASWGTPVYISVTTNDASIRKLGRQNLYLVGLVYQYSPSYIDNRALLRRNLETRFRLDGLHQEWYTEDDPSTKPILHQRMQLNYVFPFLDLYTHYRAAGEMARADKWKQLSLTIARRDGAGRMLSLIRDRIQD